MCMTYEITCPATGDTAMTNDLDRAMDICFDMHQDHDGAYACIRDDFGNIVGEYGDVMEAVANHLM